MSEPASSPSNAASEADVGFLREAIGEARLAAERGEVPVGAVVVVGGEIVGRGHNLRETLQDPTAHAELIAIRAAAQALGSFRLIGSSCYVTLEPCPMCAGALVNARVERVIYGPGDPKAGATRTLYEIGSDPRLNHRFQLVTGVLEDECAALLKTFFAEVRQKQKAARAAAKAEPTGD